MRIPPRVHDWMSRYIPGYKNYLLKRELKRTQMLTNKVKQELLAAAHMLKRIDRLMSESGMSRQKRRQFWSDFYKNEQAREEVVKSIITYYEQAKETK